MTKVLKMLGGSGLALVLGVLLLGVSGSFNPSTAAADSPPAPPARFVGSVTVNGAPATAGTTIEVKIGDTTCGVTTVFLQGTQARYSVDSPALDPGAAPNCGTDGAAVSFTVGGTKANEAGTWYSYQLNTVNLTVTTATATPTTPVASVTPKTPIAPVTGSGTTPSSEGTAVWLFALLGLGAIAFGVGGVTVARKSGR